MASTFKSAVASNIGTSLTDVYIAPASTQSTMIGLSVANSTASTVYAQVVMDKGASTAFVIKNAPIPAGSSLVLFGGDQKLVLETGNKIQVQSSAATQVDAIASVLELT